MVQGVTSAGPFQPDDLRDLDPVGDGSSRSEIIDIIADASVLAFV